MPFRDLNVEIMQFLLQKAYDTLLFQAEHVYMSYIQAVDL